MVQPDLSNISAENYRPARSAADAEIARHASSLNVQSCTFCIPQDTVYYDPGCSQYNDSSCNVPIYTFCCTV